MANGGLLMLRILDCGAACLILGVLLFSPPASGRTLDFNDTLIHYYLTSAQNLELELQRAGHLTSSILADAPPVEQPEGEPNSGHVEQNPVAGEEVDEKAPQKIEDGSFIFRLDFLLPEKDQTTTFGYGVLGAVSPRYQIENLNFRGFGGMTFFTLMQKSGNSWKSGVMFFNFLLGGDVGFKNWVTFRSALSMNGVTTDDADDTIWDFDQISASIESPILGLFGKARFDIARGQPRDIESGVHFDFGDFGLVTGAYTHRFDYQITGTILRNDDGTVLYVPADYGGVLRWDYISPWDGQLWFGFHGCVASVPGSIRFLLGEVGMGLLDDRIHLFARGGTAYSRLVGTQEFGGSAGLLYKFVELGAFMRISVGRNEPSLVDRLGDVGKFVLSLDMAMALL